MVSDPFAHLKKEQFTVIFGGYKNEGYSKLESLRDYLRTNNYQKTHLVTNLNTPSDIKNRKLDADAEIAAKSVHWAKKAQVALFVFFKDVPYGSADVEMTIRLSAHEKLAICTSFFVENGVKLEVVERGFIKAQNNYNVSYFDSKNDLHKMAKNYCFNHLLQDKCTDTIML